MGGRNWKHKKEAVMLHDVNEEEIAQSGQHMRLIHSTEEMDAMALASKVRRCRVTMGVPLLSGLYVM